MTHSFLPPLLALPLLAAVTLPAAAEIAPPLRQAEASRVIYDAGMAQRDALLVLAAAKLRRNLALQPVERTADEGEAATGAPLDGDTMLNEARALAVGDPAMLALIEDVAAESSKGVVSGPVYNIARIGPKKSDTYRSVPFKSGEYAEIYVEAKDSSDLNLKVHDDQNRLVCSDTDISAIAYCGWKPRQAGSYTITIENMTANNVQYSLITN